MRTLRVKRTGLGLGLSSECLPRVPRALSSMPGTARKKKIKKALPPFREEELVPSIAITNCFGG